MIFVDQLFPTAPNAQWPYKSSCHLASFPVDKAELKAFAQKIGLKDEWFQDGEPPQKLPHYDLTESMRMKAIANGANAISTRNMTFLWIQYKRDPKTVEGLIKNLLEPASDS